MQTSVLLFGPCIKCKGYNENITKDCVCEECEDICYDIGCDVKRHGIFKYCKEHFDKEFGRFRRWTPANVGYKTLMNIMKYSIGVDYSGIREEHINKGRQSVIPLLYLKYNKEWKTQIGNIVNSGYNYKGKENKQLNKQSNEMYCEWECIEGHVWYGPFTSVKTGVWCLQCHNNSLE